MMPYAASLVRLCGGHSWPVQNTSHLVFEASRAEFIRWLLASILECPVLVLGQRRIRVCLVCVATERVMCALADGY
jgi:hypothetical protein